MSTRHEDSEHVLVVEIEDGKPTYHLEHTTDCPFVEDDLGGIPMTTHTCMTGAFWNEAGSDSLSEKPGEPGRYRVQAWYQGPGWAGSYPIEPEGWIDVLEAVPPGPWRVDDGFGSKIAVYGRLIDGVARTLITEIDTSYDVPFDRDECANDARLIALAPELAALALDMGEELRAMRNHRDIDWNEVDSLLARLDQLGKEPSDG